MFRIRDPEVYTGDRPIYAEAVFSSASALIKKTGPLEVDSLDSYKTDPAGIDEAAKQLTKLGFEVIAANPFGLSIIGSRKLYEKYLNTKILYSFVKGHKKRIAIWYSLFYMDEVATISPEFEEKGIASVYIPPPLKFHSFPNVKYNHLIPPNQISSITRADGVHFLNIKGHGIKVAMVDSGLNSQHPYYVNTNYGYHIDDYNITVHGNYPQLDNYGHGTGMAINLLAVAPECELHIFKIDDRTVNPPYLAAFKDAVNFARSHGARIISNSWGCDYDAVVEASVIDAVKKYHINVVFSCGDIRHSITHPDFPGCMNEVISVGGVTPDKKDPTNPDKLKASSFALSGYNPLYPNRRCPDVCGICGSYPRGILIVMPTQAKSDTDWAMNSANQSYPDGDETQADDGWFVGSGTSAAAPQVAGGIALLLSKNPQLNTDQIKQILMDSAIDIKKGKSGSGIKPIDGPDDATGYGFINLEEAVNICP